MLGGRGPINQLVPRGPQNLNFGVPCGPSSGGTLCTGVEGLISACFVFFFFVG